jgi:hypothetical protein
MTFSRFSAVLALTLTFGLSACGGSDSASDTTAAPDTTVVADTTMPADTIPATDSTTKKAEYCGASDELADLSFDTLTNDQASAAATALDSVYTSFPDLMKKHAGPLLDFFLQFQSMGGTANEEYDGHLSDLNEFLSDNC